MGWLNKLFTKRKNNTNKVFETSGQYMPNLKIPADEKFTIYFKKNGGKFIYCEDFAEIQEALGYIISENQWQDKLFYTIDSQINEQFSSQKISFTNNLKQGNIFFTSCEHLVADNGSILVCSHQIKNKKVNELPDNLIVFATTSQLVNSISDGLKIIKQKYPNQIPDNITSLKNFGHSEEYDNDFLSYGSIPKNLYLLLMEDY